MTYLTREMIFRTARKGNRLTIDPDSLTAKIHYDIDFDTNDYIYLVEFKVNSFRGQKLRSTFVEFEYSETGLEQANKLIKRITGQENKLIKRILG